MVTTRKRIAPKMAEVELPKEENEDPSSSRMVVKRTKQTNSPIELSSTVVVKELFEASGIVQTTTKGGWCLQEGLTRVLEVDQSRQLLPVLQKHGLPSFYSVVNDATSCRHAKTTAVSSTKPRDCFQSLCRIIAGQQLAGAAAQAMWHRLIKVVEATSSSNISGTNSSSNGADDSSQTLTPEAILFLAEKGVEDNLRKPAGLSGAKARSVVALAQAFADGDVTEAFLTAPTSTEDEIRSKLLPIKGIGPWTCDMFLMFYLEKGNVLPVGDLGVRKGMAKFFGLRGKGYKGSLCNIKDKAVMEQVMAPYEPYQSLISYYMWAVADTKDFYRDTKESEMAKTSTPSKAMSGKTQTRAAVTP